jgi:transcriptional regulator with XRE-family HTH domain
MKTVTETKAIRKLKQLLEIHGASSIAVKLGIARGTLLSLIAGVTEPRLSVLTAADKEYGIKQEDWT